MCVAVEEGEEDIARGMISPGGGKPCCSVWRGITRRRETLLLGMARDHQEEDRGGDLCLVTAQCDTAWSNGNRL
jgi:hypothetical protein